MDDLRQGLERYLADPVARREPDALFQRLVTQAPVLDLERIWVVSGYAEIVAAAVHPAVLTDPKAVGLEFPESPVTAPLRRLLPMRSGADHTRLRQVVSTPFSARATEQLRPAIAAAVDELLAPLLGAGQLDVVEDLARPLPVALTCAMMGVPAGTRDRVRGWATVLARAALTPWPSAEATAALAAVLDELRQYVEELCRHRAGSPVGAPGSDLVGRLVAAHRSGRLTDDELLEHVILLFINGLDTLTSGLAVAAWQLLTRPELGRLVRERPELAEPAFEECLRLLTPIRVGGRITAAEVELGGVTIPARSVLTLLFAAGNRDPRQFPDPHRFRPDRPPRRHLGYGHGPHRCLGAPLSTAVGGIVLGRLADLPGLATELTAQTAPWSRSLGFGGLDALPVTFAPVTFAPAGGQVAQPALAGSR
jgi:cytochrome P450